MAFLTIGGVEVDVAVGNAAREPGAQGGEDERAVDGTLRSAYVVFPTKREWRFTTRPLTVTEADALRATGYLDGVYVACGGTAIVGSAGGTVLCRVREGTVSYVRDLTQAGVVKYQEVVPLTLTEV
jgi:hypothetical protein